MITLSIINFLIKTAHTGYSGLTAYEGIILVIPSRNQSDILVGANPRVCPYFR